MTEAEARDFVERFAAARAIGRGEEFWHPHGRLHYPFANRVIGGDENGLLNDLSTKQAPNLTWELRGWTFRGDVIVIEWLCTNRYDHRTVRFSGVDKLTLEAGRIIEEVVYADTAPLRAMRQGRPFEALIQLPDREIPLAAPATAAAAQALQP